MYINKNLEDIIVSSNTTLKDSLSVLTMEAFKHCIVDTKKEFKHVTWRYKRHY